MVEPNVESDHVVSRALRYFEFAKDSTVLALFDIKMDNGEERNHRESILRNDVYKLDMVLTPYLGAGQRQMILDRWSGM